MEITNKSVIPPNRRLRTTLIGIILNAAIIKALRGVFGHSYALKADAITSTTDIFYINDVVSGIKMSNHTKRRKR